MWCAVVIGNHCLENVFVTNNKVNQQNLLACPQLSGRIVVYFNGNLCDQFRRNVNSCAFTQKSQIGVFLVQQFCKTWALWFDHHHHATLLRWGDISVRVSSVTKQHAFVCEWEQWLQLMCGPKPAVTFQLENVSFRARVNIPGHIFRCFFFFLFSLFGGGGPD